MYILVSVSYNMYGKTTGNINKILKSNFHGDIIFPDWHAIPI